MLVSILTNSIYEIFYQVEGSIIRFYTYIRKYSFYFVIVYI